MIKANYSDFAVINPSFASVVALERRRAQFRRLADSPYLDKLPGFKRRNLWIAIAENKRLIAQCRGRLDICQIVSPQLRRAAASFVRKTGKNEEQLRLNFGFPPKPEPESSLSAFGAAFFAVKKQRAESARRGDLMSRLLAETAIAHRRGWYMVFDTLTVDDLYFDDVFAVRSTCFKNYIRAVYRSIGVTLGVRKADADRGHSDFHRYLAVNELGSQTGRRHIHVIHFCKALPVGSYDPNGAIDVPRNREIESFKGLWRYGWNAPIAMRYSADDGFGRAGWRWPVEKQADGSHAPLPAGSPARVARYVGKYITKQQEAKQWKMKTTKKMNLWRTRMNQGFGTDWIRKVVQRFPSKTLILAAMENPSRRIEMPNSPSWRQVRKEVLRVLARRKLLAPNFLASAPRPRSSILFRTKMKTPKLSKAPGSAGMNSGLSKQAKTDTDISDLFVIRMDGAALSPVWQSIDTALARLFMRLSNVADPVPFSSGFNT